VPAPPSSLVGYDCVYNYFVPAQRPPPSPPGYQRRTPREIFVIEIDRMSHSGQRRG